ncbi:hypothetical protein AB0C12_27585 [Actinoplanes sp. NPDC048967]|uniref:hypothetical protein n=1 Tax=Actinoplanes sp. NPDC048967 TaxID=3155269 RepID=UPI0033CC0116
MGDVPAFVRRHRFVRRGSVDAPPFVIDVKGGEAAEQRMAAERAAVLAILDEPGTARPLAAAARAWLDGDPDVTPLGAAGALTALSIRIHYPENSADILTPLADLWIARHGLLFAAQAAVEQALLGVQEGERVNPATYGDLSLAPVAFGEAAHRGPRGQILLRVRAALAVTTEDEYAEVVETLRPYRDRHWSAAVATSVLLPGERDWVEQDVRTVLANGSPKPELAALLLLAAGTAEQARALAPHLDNWWSLPMPGVLATLADGLGPGAAGAVLVWFDVPYMTAESQQRMLSVLTDMDDDAVFAELLARIDRKYVPAAVLEAAARFPARAMRMFAEAVRRCCAPTCSATSTSWTRSCPRSAPPPRNGCVPWLPPLPPSRTRRPQPSRRCWRAHRGFIAPSPRNRS